MPKTSKEAAFVHVVTIQLLTLSLGILFLLLVITGSWPVRIIAVTVVGGSYAWARWYEFRWIRFRPGDSVLVTSGRHKDLRGTVVEPLHEGWGARVLLPVGNQSETVDFHCGYELRKLRKPPAG